jgi:large subunit ribosomal protein L9
MILPIVAYGDPVLKKEAEEILKKFDGMVLELTEEANEEGHLYASVNEKKIVEALKKQKINLKPDQILLPEHIKTIGEHEVELELHPEVKTKIKILVSKK